MNEANVVTPLYSGANLARLRRRAYPALATTVVLIWFFYFALNHRWEHFSDYWPMSLTMLFGSFIGSSTPQGSAAVGFPVLTKLLQIPAADSRTFGLMVQSVGMTLASVLILARSIRILPKVILWTTLGSALGIILGTYFFTIPDPYPRILFTLGITTFGVALFISRWGLKWTPRHALPGWGVGYLLLFILVGVVGGFLTAQTGSGANIVTFVVLTLAFGIDEKIGTPTSVIIMALNSLVGFFLHGVVSHDIGIVWNYWLVTVPIVAFGAPLGAYVVSRVSRDVLIMFVLFLISIEMITTLLLIPFSSSMVTVIAFVLGGCALSFFAMLCYRQKWLALRPSTTD